MSVVVFHQFNFVRKNLLPKVVLSYMAQVNCSVTLNTGDDVSSGINVEDDVILSQLIVISRSVWLMSSLYH